MFSYFLDDHRAKTAFSAIYKIIFFYLTLGSYETIGSADASAYLCKSCI